MLHLDFIILTVQGESKVCNVYYVSNRPGVGVGGGKTVVVCMMVGNVYSCLMLQAVQVALNRRKVVCNIPAFHIHNIQIYKKKTIHIYIT